MSPELATTWFIDHDHPVVREYAESAVGDSEDMTEQAVALFHRVRDGIRYNPYGIDYSPEAFRASDVAKAPESWCVPKSVLLVASARHVGIPARLGFADVVNHLTSAKLADTMGTDLFAWHGYAELLLPDPSTGADRWFKLSSAFNIELCERFGVKVLDFDGTADALMHPYDEAGNRHMEYVNDRGSFDDLPLPEILADFAELYGDTFGQATTAETAGDDAFSAS